MIKKCCRCDVDKNTSDFRKDKSRADGLQSYCKQCAKEDHRSKWKETYGDRYKEQHNKRRKECAAKLSALKSSLKCLKCNEADPACLEFHHLDPSQKEYGIASMVQLKWDKLMLEISKCVCLCSNCHKKFHAGRFEITNNTTIV